MPGHAQNKNKNKGTNFAIDDIIGIAIDKCCKIRFRYIKENGETTIRKIRPLALFRYKNFDGKTHFYVTGFCELRSDYRTFRLDRISEMILINETFPHQQVDIYSLLGRREDGFSGFYLPRINFLNYLNALKPLPKTNTPSLGEKIYGEPRNELVARLKVNMSDSDYLKLWNSSKLINAPKWCRSPLEEEVFSELDGDNKVHTYEVEPFKISYWAGQETKAYVPDLLVRYKDGRKIIVEIKPECDIILPINQAKFKAIEQFANENGYRFEVWTDWTMIPATWKEVAVSYDKPVHPLGHNERVFQHSNSNDSDWWRLLIFWVAVYLVYLLFFK